MSSTNATLKYISESAYTWVELRARMCRQACVWVYVDIISLLSLGFLNLHNFLMG